MRQLCAAIGLFAILSLPWVASAEEWPRPESEPTEEVLGQAQTLYEDGTRAADEHRWADAISSFQRSYALSGASVALFSLAYTFRVVGRFREARDAFDQLLGTHDDLEPDIRTQAEQLRLEVAEKVAVLSLTGLEERGELTLDLDGSPRVDDGERPLEVDADPGSHRLRIDLPQHQPFEWSGELEPGERRSVAVSFEPLGSPILESPWLWAGVGAVVLVGLVVAIVVAQDAAQLDPTSEFHLEL
jgi:hypothetical protein